MLLHVENISKTYTQIKKWKRQRQIILNDINFMLMKSESVGLVGESGSGKSTLARIISGIERPDRGRVMLNGQHSYHRKYRYRQFSIVFQDYTTSVNPAMNVFSIISEPLTLQENLPSSLIKEQVADLLNKVNLSTNLMNRYAHELSGGQVQRVCIARALATSPELIILDEAISSLDIPTQVQILDLLEALKQEFSLSYFFITHDIQALCYFCQRVLFFNEHTIVAQCSVKELGKITHPYALKLLDSVI